ncbi:MAG: hypothetical protein ACP5FY_08440, partial [Kosmotogaceae bacterium]
RDWSLTDSATKTFSLTLKNVSALPSGSPYYLTNTATVTEDDTGEESSDNAVVTITVSGGSWKGETAWGGYYLGPRSDEYLSNGNKAWWYYFDTNGPATQDIYAGQNKVAGASVTYKDDKLTIVLGPNMRLQNTDETVKIAGYDEGELPASRPPMGSSNPNQIYAGTDLVISVSPARYYAIHLDVEVKQ